MLSWRVRETYLVLITIYKGTLKICFGQNTNEIAKFNIVDEKMNFNPVGLRPLH